MNIKESCFAAPKNSKQNSAHYFIKNFLNRQELQEIAFNHSSDIGFKDVMNFYKKYVVKTYFFSDKYYSCIR